MEVIVPAWTRAQLTEHLTLVSVLLGPWFLSTVGGQGSTISAHNGFCKSSCQLVTTRGRCPDFGFDS